MIRKILRWTILCCLGSSLFAQSTVKIEGIVSEAKSGLPLQDVNIYISGTGIGTVTDQRGRFQIERLFTGTYTLVASHIGYKSEQIVNIRIRQGQPQFLKISLKDKPLQMQSVAIAAERLAPSDNSRTIFISEQAIRESPAQSLTEILAAVPGIDIQSSGGRESSQKISIRGSETNQVLVLLDGVPVNDVLTGGSDLSNIPLHMVESIEVTRGAASSDQGNGAIGGSVHIRTRHTLKNMVQIKTSCASFGHRLFESTLSSHVKRVDFSLSYQSMKSDNDYTYSYQPLYEDRVQNSRINSDIHSRSAFAILSVNPGDHHASVMAHAMKSERGLPGRIDQWTGYARENNDRIILGVNYQWKDIDLSCRYHDFHIEQTNIWPSDSELKYRGPMQYHYSSKIKTHFQSASLSHDFGNCLQTRFKVDGRQLHFSDANLLSQTAGPVDSAEDNSFGAAFYPSIRLAAFRNFSLLRIDPAIRYDQIRVQDSDTERNHSQWSPSISLQTDFGRRNRLYLRTHFSKGFRAPTFADLFYQDLRIQGKPDLLPEKSVYREISSGLIAHAKGEWQLDWTRFFSDVEDLICWRLGSFETFRPYNTDAKISGTEWLAGYTSACEWLSCNLSYETLEPISQDPALTVHGKIIPYKPLQSLKTKLTIKMRSIQLMCHYRWIGKRYVTESNTLALDPYRLMDTSLTIHGNQARIGWDATFSVLNIMNTHYEIIYKMPLAPRSFLFDFTFSILPSP